jgi:acetyl esterase
MGDAALKRDRITGGRYLERGQPVTVLIRWSGKGPRNVLIQRADGSRVVRPFRGLRRPGEGQPEGKPAVNRRLRLGKSRYTVDSGTA